MQLVPAGCDQLAGIEVWTTLADRGCQCRWQLTVGYGQRNAEVIGLDLPTGSGRGAFDRLAPRPRLGGGKETA